MKKILPLFFLLYAQAGFSQNTFTKFIENKKVQFAMLANDTFHFSNPDLSSLLRESFNKGKIKVSLLEDDKATGKLTYANKEAVINRIAPNRESKVVDAEGNVTATVVEAEDPLFSTRYFDEQTRDLVEVQQVLYLESGKLRSYIPYISPKYAVFTSWGQKLGISNAFSTGFNKSRSLSSSVKKKAGLAGITRTMLRLDTVLQQNMLKQLYGQNLLQALWPHLHKKQYDIYRMDSAMKIPFEKINMSLVQNLRVPVYDAEGNVTGSKKISMDDQPLNPAMISSVQIVQSWYYHARKNLLFNEITELVLYAKKSPQEAGVEITAPILKIMLK
jgi:hypothetical protein